MISELNLHLGDLARATLVLLVPTLLLSTTGSATEAGPEWETLFDGSSTSAWRAYQRTDFPDRGWVVERGSLKTVPGGDVVDIVTRNEYENFGLILEWRVSPRGNSGIFFHVVEKSAVIWEGALEFQVLDDRRHPDGRDARTSAGALYGLIATRDKMLRPVGEYNEARVLVLGNHVEHWLNGVKVMEFERGTQEFKALIGKSKFRGLSHFAVARKGHVGLQHHGEEVWFRNVKIRRLKSR